jgi:hypothetical protein
MDFRISYSRKKGTKTEVESTVRTVWIMYDPYDYYFGTDFEELCCFLEVLACFPRQTYNIYYTILG